MALLEELWGAEALSSARLMIGWNSYGFLSCRAPRAQQKQDICRQTSVIERKIVEDEDLNKKMLILTSVSGIGPATASKLIAEIPELGQVSNKK